MTFEEATEDFIHLCEEAREFLTQARGRLEVAREQEVVPFDDRSRLRRVETQITGAHAALGLLERKAYERITPGDAASSVA